MIIHAYFTNGFFPWAKLFLRSFKLYNGTGNPIILSTRELVKHEVKKLYNLYPNIRVENEDFNIKDFSKRAKVDKKTLLKYKHEVETKHVTKTNKVWKLMIAGDDRIKSIRKVMKNIDTNDNYLLHFDIDMYFRSNLDDLFKFVRNHDISIRLRLSSPKNRKTMIGVQGYKIGRQSLDFLNRWIRHIDNVEPAKRHQGYGQTSCYYAYEEVKSTCRWGSVPRKFISPIMRDSDVVWSANTTKGKTENLRIFREDFKQWRKKV